MHKILVYLEPHPIRNTYTEFAFAVSILAPPLFAAAERGEVDFRIFSNEQTLDKISKYFPRFSQRLIRPTPKQSKRISRYEGEWNATSISIRTDLVNGKGSVTDLYVDILTEIYEIFKFDTLLCWSDNGAISRFSAINSHVSTCYVELGPTRSPFHETIYFDPRGTNGSAAILDADLGSLPEHEIVPAMTWPALLNNNDTSTIGIIDALYTIGAHNLDIRLPKRYVYVPMQLADDLNTLCHSPFATPLEFLQATLPRFVDQGLSVVIKGHPAAANRLYNLVHETRALQFAASFGDKVVILDRNTPPTTSLFAIGQATYICTINSSVGFEALLCGKQVITTGRAVYDVSDKLRRDIPNLENLPETVVEPEHRDRLTSFLCRHYFHPKREIVDGDALVRGIRYLHERHCDEGSRVLDAQWMNMFSYDPRDAIAAPKPATASSHSRLEDNRKRGASSMFSRLSFLFSRKRREHRTLRQLVRTSGFFDDAWYLMQNPDVRETGADPLDHFLLFGGQEGRAPSPKFSSADYLAANPDIRDAGINPLVHYLVHGQPEGRINPLDRR